MYSQHWKLNRRPFENTLEPEFFFPSHTHQAALLKMRYLIENQKGAGVLVGPTGTGKTFVIHRLAKELSQQAGPWLNFVFPQLSADDLLTDIAIRLGGEAVAADWPTHSVLPRSAALRIIERSLDEHTRARRHPVLIIDDAHLIDDPATLQALELLLNFQQPPQRMFSLILLGDRLLLSRLARLPRFDERLAVRAMLQSLSPDETARYIRFRLEVSSARNAIFDAEALAEIAELSDGVPRRINRLADLALLVGYADGRSQLTAEDVASVSEELATVGVE
ncbi:MAG: AAA family ATPase [Planctomycetota bacterium]|nr:MAG: AAA family ATPase [Planctomycetota bacterium]GDY06885.1 ATPase [Planctomycetia bacterium]